MYLLHGKKWPNMSRQSPDSAEHDPTDFQKWPNSYPHWRKISVRTSFHVIVPSYNFFWHIRDDLVLLERNPSRVFCTALQMALSWLYPIVFCNRRDSDVGWVLLPNFVLITGLFRNKDGSHFTRSWCNLYSVGKNQQWKMKKASILIKTYVTYKQL